jgi:hypothetical protein
VGRLCGLCVVLPPLLGDPARSPAAGRGGVVKSTLKISRLKKICDFGPRSRRGQ